MSERFEKKGGDTETPDVYDEDLIIYNYAPPSSIWGDVQVSGYALRTAFPVTPSKSFTLQDLMLGKLELNISLKDEGEEGGRIVGPDGAVITDPSGLIINIPANALSSGTVLKASASNISPIPLSGDVTLLKYINLDLANASLSQSALLSIPVPANYVSGSQLVIAKLININNIKRPKLVAACVVSGSIITTSGTMGGIALPCITGGGEYLILQLNRPVGIVAGRVMDLNNQPVSGAYTYTDSSIFYDLTGIDGRYITAAGIGSFTATGQRQGSPDMGTATGAIISSSAAVSLDITIQQVGLQISSIIPENNSQNISINQPIGIFFNHAINRATVNENSILITDGSANITGVMSITADNKGIAIYPSAPLKGNTLYTITIKGQITDIFGRQLGSDAASRFTTTDTTSPAIPPAGSITMSFPDAEGFVTLTATQGTVDPIHKVTLMNFTTGDGKSLNVNTDGSFTGRISIENFNDDLMLVIRDGFGNTTMTSAGVFKDTDGINWGSKFGGGILTITVGVDNRGKMVYDKYTAKIQGQMFKDDDSFKTRILNYLENPESAEGQNIRATLGYPSFFRIIAYKETLAEYRYEHFVPSIGGVPIGSIYPVENRKNLEKGGIGSDGGFGVMQLTNGKYLPLPYTVNGTKEKLPSYEQIWNWKKNIEGGIQIAKEKLEYAIAYHDQHPVADNEKAEFLRWQVYSNCPA